VVEKKSLLADPTRLTGNNMADDGLCSESDPSATQYWEMLQW